MEGGFTVYYLIREDIQRPYNYLLCEVNLRIYSMEKLVIGVVGVIVGSLLGLLRDIWGERRSSKKRASYLAVRVVGILERFIDGCVLVVGDDGYEDEQGCSTPMQSCPNIEFDSLDVDWQSLPFDLMYQIINFPSHVEEADGLIDSVVEHVAGPPDYDEFFEERAFQFSKLGLLANTLSSELRKKYGMPQREYEFWDPIEFLTQKKAKIQDTRSQRK